MAKVFTAFPTAIFNENARISMLSGDNFTEWKEKVLLTLGCSDFDLAIRVEEPPKPTESSTPDVKAYYERWERSNRLILMLIKAHISQSIRGSIPNSDKVKAYMKVVSGHNYDKRHDVSNLSIINVDGGDRVH
ncbi:uncharacterized protein LOC132612906 [Lycium barbarum]|uniref:uncharacterized protein LOC132612906 n=1 Tax=Lycium barbarum TaxID=112863 RepID=UPI00293F2D40|nr:uncharacterized protein LOC132612906 [Lycium barbarum]